MLSFIFTCVVRISQSMSIDREYAQLSFRISRNFYSAPLLLAALAMASILIAMASNLIAMALASILLAMVFILCSPISNGTSDSAPVQL